MRVTARWTILALGLLAGCSESAVTESTGAACSQDSACGVNAYCKRALTECAGLEGVVAAAGSCHRSCRSGACTCASDDDCPGASCSQGTCVGVGADCLILSCSAACPKTTLEEDVCPVCLCATCAPADGGPSDAGPLDAGSSDAGPSDGGSARIPCGGDGGTCPADQLCFAVTDCGGAYLPDAGQVNGCYPPAYSCQAPGSCAQTETCDCFRSSSGDPCQGSQTCDVDGGRVSCQFDRP